MINNISLYRIFLETAKCGSISAAARKLYVTQPAVSVGIRQLEAELGVKLFFRTPKGIKLSQEGETLYEYVKSAFGFLELGEDKLRDMNELGGGVLRIGASDMTLKFYLLEYLAKFHREHPRVRLSVSNNPTPRSLEELREGTIDFCVISEPVRVDGDIELRRVREIRDIWVRESNSYTELDGEPQEFDSLLSHTTVMLDGNTSSRRYVEDWMRKCGASESALRPGIELATSELVLDFARRQIGIGCVVEDFAKEDIRAGVLKEIPLKHPIPPRGFLLAYLKSVPLCSAARHFIDML